MNKAYQLAIVLALALSSACASEVASESGDDSDATEKQATRPGVTKQRQDLERECSSWVILKGAMRAAEGTKVRLRATTLETGHTATSSPSSAWSPGRTQESGYQVGMEKPLLTVALGTQAESPPTDAWGATAEILYTGDLNGVITPVRATRFTPGLRVGSQEDFQSVNFGTDSITIAWDGGAAVMSGCTAWKVTQSSNAE